MRNLLLRTRLATLLWRRQLRSKIPLIRIPLRLLLVVMAIALVHVLQPAADESAQSPRLPQHVADLRNAILAAARSGNIAELKEAFDMSVTSPDLGVAGGEDPIKALKTKSADGEGREILAILVDLLSMSPAAQPFGSDIENNTVYVWPYLATRPLDKLTPPEEVDLYRLVSPAKATEMREKKRWMWWCLAIAADGNWLLFKRID